MTIIVDQAIETLRRLPPGEGEALARFIMDVAAAPVALTEDERGAIALSLGQTARGEFATEEEVRTVWGRHGG